MRYGKAISEDLSWRVLRTQLFNEGHSFDEIDGLSLYDMGDVLMVRRVEAKVRQQEQKSSKFKQSTARRRKGRR